MVINAEKVAVSGKKESDKIYKRHTGYPGGLRETTLGEMRATKPEEIILHAVRGMMPKGRLVYTRDWFKFFTCINQVNPPKDPLSHYNNLHFTDKKTEAQQAYMTSLKAVSGGTGLELSSLAPDRLFLTLVGLRPP